MKIIPVIDLKNNLVVHAKLGDRENYQPINTPLCASADVYRVIEAFLSVHEFDTFYIADLNAITRCGDHNRLIAQVVATFPKLRFWVDKGHQPYSASAGAPENSYPVLGSECYQDNNVAELKDFNNRFILSLDYSGTAPLGAPKLFSGDEFWPEQIIIMTLARVGSHSGPDIEKLKCYLQHYPGKNFIAAGGIRHTNDLQMLMDIGIKQALLASALHSGAIQGEDIINFRQKNTPASRGIFNIR